VVSRKHISLGLICDFGSHFFFFHNLRVSRLCSLEAGPFCLWIVLGDPERSCFCVISATFMSLFER